MNTNELPKKSEYDFLITNPDLRNVIYLTLSGSHGYGKHNENSDADLRDVLLQNTLNAQLEHFRRTYTSFENGAIRIYTDCDKLKFDIDLKNYPVNDFIGIYSELSNTVKAYNKLNHRNNKKMIHIYINTPCT